MIWAISTVLCGGPGPKFPDPTPTQFINNRDNSLSPCQAYQYALESNPTADLLIMTHDDIEIFDPAWLPQILALFEAQPDCVVVGLGGALGLGSESLYKRPYRLSDMARETYLSNQRDWRTHGGHLEPGTVRQVAVCDAFFMAIRTGWLCGIGGWPVDRLTHHCLDLWVCLEAARHRKQVWAVGVECMHYGGGTSTKPAYRDAKWLQGKSLVGDHEAPHRWLWEEFKDVLPVRVKP